MSSSAARKTPGSSLQVWFVAQNSVLKGPYTTDQLQKKVNSKEISFFDYCWRNGFSEWRLISSIEDFDRREILHSVPAYPTVEIPAGANKKGAQGSAMTSQRAASAQEDPKKVYIQFARTRRILMGPYEWAAALLLCMAISYASVQFALTEVTDGFFKRMKVLEVGRLRTFGKTSEAVPSVFWEPLYSAPGWRDIPTGEAAEMFRMPVRLEGHPRAISSHVWQLGEKRVQFQVPPENSLDRDDSIDPVYSQRWAVEGYLSPGDEGMIYASEPGDPQL